MNFKQPSLVAALTLLCTGCAFMPITDPNQPYAKNCEMTTKRMTLDQPRSAQAFSCQKDMYGGDFLSCLIVAGIIIPAGSLIISGSIVLVNNSLHWIEYQGICDKEDVEQQVQDGEKPQVQDNDEQQEVAPTDDDSNNI